MRVLQIQLDTALGGIESFLLNIYKRIDKDKIQFDFIEYGEEERSFDKQFENLGARIFKLPDRIKNPIKAKKRLKRIIKENKYSVVHIHKNSLSDISAIKICKRLKVPTIIIHSHNSNRDNKIIVLLHKINSHRIKLDDYVKFACSKKAADWLFGDNGKKAIIVNNGIEIEKFIYNKTIREKTRKKLGIDSNYVIGNVGRLSEQKNPEFLIKLFHNLRKKHSEIKLLWVGDGELMESIKKLTSELGEEDNIIFTGKVNNPEYYYQAMDLFVMPSFYEGFPISAIEAQTSGLQCILSDNITKEAAITENVSFIPLQQENLWINFIEKIINKKFERKNQLELMERKGYNIQSTVDFIQDFYLKFENAGEDIKKSKV